MEVIEEVYGKPDYEKYPGLGYSHETWVQMVRDSERYNDKDMGEILAYETTALLKNLQDSPLHEGYYVFAVLKDKVPATIGIGQWDSNKRPVAAARKKYAASTVVFLAYSLTKEQATLCKQTLERRLMKYGWKRGEVEKAEK